MKNSILMGIVGSWATTLIVVITMMIMYLMGGLGILLLGISFAGAYIGFLVWVFINAKRKGVI